MDIQMLVNLQREFFISGKTLNVSFRIEMLKKLRKSILLHESEIIEALKNDLNKSSYESYLTEIGIVLSEITYFLKRMKQFTKTKKVKTPITLFHAKSMIIPHPYGVCLIMSPWNYPFQLAIDPLIGAIAAGNTAILKPAAYSTQTSMIIRKIIENAFSMEYIAVVTGGREENTNLLNQRFDYIFFTGSIEVGKLVMEKASKHLTPISLELGGKSPCIVDEVKNLRLAAKRIAFGKYLNSGQTCLAPDYILIIERIKDEFIVYLKEAIEEFFGKKPLENVDLPKIINKHHHQRLINLMKNEKIVIGGDYNVSSITPTVLDQVTMSSLIMKEEIFGPILPIITVKNRGEIFELISTLERPLALYLFTDDKNFEKEVINTIPFGGATINDTIMHFASSEMGFGGIGNSGFGSYHGKASFDTFTHYKSILKRSKWIDLSIRYHPYSKNKDRIVRKLMK